MFRPTPTARWRSLAKAITWRLCGSLATFVLSFTVVYVLGTREHPIEAARIGGVLAIAELLVKILLFYVHDRIWARIPFGRADTQPLPPRPDEFNY